VRPAYRRAAYFSGAGPRQLLRMHIEASGSIEFRTSGDRRLSYAQLRYMSSEWHLTSRHGNDSIGAGEGIRTLDPNLGKVVLYP
jgi:hypothetical protein